MTDGSKVGAIDGVKDGSIDGSTDGLSDGEIEEGAEVGLCEGGPELHVDRPEAAHAGYTQAGV